MSKNVPMSRFEAVSGDPALKGTRVFKFSWRPAVLVVGSAFALWVGVSVIQGSFSVGALALLGGLTLPVAGYFAYLAMRVRLVIDDYGVEFRESNRVQRIPWEQLDGVAVGAPPGRPGVRQYRLFSMGQVLMHFENEIDDSERAYRTIERRISVTQYPRYKDALDRGNTVGFGLVSLSRHQLGVRHVTLPLAEAKLARGGGEVRLMRRGQPEPLIVADEGDVQNINVLLRCLNEIDPRVVSSGA